MPASKNLFLVWPFRRQLVDSRVDRVDNSIANCHKHGLDAIDTQLMPLQGIQFGGG